MKIVSRFSSLHEALHEANYDRSGYEIAIGQQIKSITQSPRYKFIEAFVMEEKNVVRGHNEVFYVIECDGLKIINHFDIHTELVDRGFVMMQIAEGGEFKETRFGDFRLPQQFMKRSSVTDIVNAIEQDDDCTTYVSTINLAA